MKSITKIKVIKKYKKSKKYKDNEHYDVIFSLFKSFSFEILEEVHELLSDEENMNKEMRRFKRWKEKRNQANTEAEKNENRSYLYAYGNRGGNFIIPKLIEHNVISIKDDGYKLDQKFVKCLEHFCDFATIIM